MRPFGCHVTILNTLDPLGKFQGKVDEGFLVGYSVCSKACRVFNSRTRIVQENFHVNFMENKPNVAGSGPAWLFDIDSLSQTMNYHLVIAENQSNTHTGFQDTEKAGEEGTQTYVLFLVLSDGSTNSQNNNKDAHADGKEHDDDIQKSMSPDIHSSSSGAQTRKQGDKTENKDKGKSPVVTITGFRNLNAEFEEYNDNSSNGVNAASSLVSIVGQNSINNTNDFSAAGPSNAVMLNLEDLSHDANDVGAEADINNLKSIILDSPIPTTRIHKDHPTSQIIGDLSLTTQTKSMARAVRDQAYSDIDYAGASLDKKSTTGGCQFLGCRLISWQCKKQTVVATSSTEVEYVAAASGCAQVLWIQNQLLDYGLGFELKMQSEAAEGFEQIIDFLSGSYIHYALTVKGVVCLPNEEIFAGLAQMGYKKPSTKLTFYKAFFSSQRKFLIHTILQSLSAKRTSWNEFSTAMASAVICLSQGQRFNFSKYIFDSLVRNVDRSSKFYMYPRFIQLIIQAQVGDLSTHTTRFISPALTQKVQVDAAVAAAVIEDVVDDVDENVAHVATPSPPPHDIPSPSQEPSSPLQQQQSSPQAPPQDANFQHSFNKFLMFVLLFLSANKIKSSKLRRLRKVGTSQRVGSSDDMKDVFNKERMIADMDTNEGIELVKDAEIAESEGRQADKQAEIYNIDVDHSSKVLSMQEDNSEVQEVVEVVTTAKLILEVVTAIASQFSSISTTIPAVSATIPAAAPTVVAADTRRRKGVIIRDLEEELSLKTSAETPAKTLKLKDKGKGIMIEASKPMKKKDQIELDAKYARKLHEELNKDDADFNKDVDWDVAMEHVNQKSSTNPQYIKRYQGMKKRPQTESEARKNMMIYLKNTAGYKMDFFKGMSYADICPIFQARFDENMRFLFKSREEIEEEDEEIIKSINETPAQKAAKRRKLNEEAQEAEALKKQLEIVHNEDDDVFTEATPIRRKVPVVNYEIVMINNKPRYKIIRADDTHQLYISFITLLKNFDREDLEDLWRIVKDRFSTSKPTNFSDDYLLSTLKTMFEKTDGQDAIWRNQQSVYGQALVKS
uniref:Putative reverse transcriptase, RNA-dependent DNA polymerase n=1 Tax=Tanacetum cinerariifolium TaxID=118510 RepID=A0A6L2P8J7_TANCI|nr:putative reverse transcriptase, RNA-dependent DNA polymerase [Tanacetum cinerariifolium]